MAGKVISFINMKGGVGKTSLCVGIGEYLAKIKNQKILFIDLDPQFNTTQTLMNAYDLEEKYMTEYAQEENNTTVKRLFDKRVTLSRKQTMPKKEDIIVRLDEYIDIIPGTIDLILVDSDNDGTKAKSVKKFIRTEKLKEEYDFILIDCPPTITVYTNAALIASDFYLVPVRIDRYSVLGISLLKQVIDQLLENEELELKPLGIVYTMITGWTQKANELKSIFEESDIVKEVGIFDNYTSYVNDLLVGKSGNMPSNYKKSARDIELIGEEFLMKVDEYETR